MNRRDFCIAFTAVAGINTGLTTIIIIKGIKYCIVGAFAPAVLQLYIGTIGAYSVLKSLENIKKLENQ